MTATPRTLFIILAAFTVFLTLLYTIDTSRAQEDAVEPGDVVPIDTNGVPNFVGNNMQLVESFMDQTRANLPTAKYSDGSAYIPPGTPENMLTGPIIPANEAKRIINRGFLSGLAQMCGLNWEARSFEPFIAAEREQRLWNDIQMAYVSLLHGVAQGHTSRIMGNESTPVCDEAREEQVENMLREAAPGATEVEDLEPEDQAF